MRNALIPILALMPVASASIFAQGVVSFTNTGTGLNAPVTNAVTGQMLSGSGFLVQCYAGPANTLESDPQVMVGKSIVFQNATGISSPAILTGLQSFGIAPVSEPSLIGFLGCGF